MKTKNITSKEFKSIYSRVPRLCVEVIIRTNDGILLTKRAIKPVLGQWHIPGGTIIMGETIEQAVKRVAKQELGVKVEIERMLGMIEYHIIKNHFGQVISLAWLAEIISLNDIKLDRQASDFKFFKIIPKNTVREQKLFLERFLERGGKKSEIIRCR